MQTNPAPAHVVSLFIEDADLIDARCREAVKALHAGARRVALFTRQHGVTTFAFKVLRGPRDFAVIEHRRCSPMPFFSAESALRRGAEMLPSLFEA